MLLKHGISGQILILMFKHQIVNLQAAFLPNRDQASIKPFGKEFK